MSCSRLVWHLEQSPSKAGDPKKPHLPRHFFVDRGAAAGSAAPVGAAGAVAEMASARASDGWKGTACAGATSSSANCEGRSSGRGSLRSDGEAAAGDAGSRGDRCGDAGGACMVAAVAAVVAGGGGGRRGTGSAYGAGGLCEGARPTLPLSLCRVSEEAPPPTLSSASSFSEAVPPPLWPPPWPPCRLSPSRRSRPFCPIPRVGGGPRHRASPPPPSLPPGPWPLQNPPLHSPLHPPLPPQPNHPPCEGVLQSPDPCRIERSHTPTRRCTRP
mmetsp:Transcript_18005/g.57366  ORF Transcript_18005/g.57366 Transcript_18005/m.57366 type:complete len:272 (-) Transcript_18005:225-1040(-)